MAIKRITTNLIKDSDIATVDIANNAITAAKITDGNITTAKLADLSVTAGKLAGTLDLTGKTITVATATTGDNDTSPASTAFVQQEIAALVDSSPDSLNTLNELAAALGDDASFSTTVTNSIATKLPLAGGTMTGDLKIVNSSGATLDINSNASAADSKILLHEGTSASPANGASIRYDGANNLFKIGVGSSVDTTRLTIARDTGNVGIGTSSPSYPFHLTGNGDTVAAVTAGASSVAALNLGNDTNKADGGIRYDNSTDALIFRAANAEKMRITSDGTLLLGQTTANANAAVFELTGKNSTQGTIRITPDSNKGSEVSHIHYGSTGDWYIRSASTSGKVIINDAGGNVGIGTTSPTEKLTVNGAITTTAALVDDRTSTGSMDFISGITRFVSYGASGENGAFSFNTASGGSSSSQKVVINGSGSVGIGTANPGAKLDVESTGVASTPTVEITNTSSSTFNHSINAYAPNLTAGENNIFIIGRAGSTKNSGYIGYKYSSPGSNANLLTFGHWAADNLMNLTGEGKLGIGTESPDNILHIKTTASGGPQIQMGDGTNYGFINFDGTSLQISTQRDMVDGTWYNTSKSWGGINIVGDTGGSSITMTTATGPNTAPVTRCKLDQNGRFYFGGTSSFAHNTYAHAAVFTKNSTPLGTVVIEDSDVSSGIGNTVLNCYLRDQDPATFATFIKFTDGGGTVGSITHNDDGGGVTYNTTSDYRLKENVDYDWDGLSLLNQLKPAKFNFIRQPSKTLQGFLAHEVKDIVPSSVQGDKDHMEPTGTVTDSDGNVVYENVYEHFCKEGQTWTQTGTEPVYQELDYSRLVPLLTKAIQEQQTIIDDLKSRLDEAGL